MTKRTLEGVIDVMTVDYYPRQVPPVYSQNTIFSISKVILNSSNSPTHGDPGLLEASWQKSMTNIAGWRITQVSVSKPAFLGDVNYQYLVEINLPFMSPNEGRLNDQVRQVACSFMANPDPGAVRSIYQAANDEGTWFRFKHFYDIDKLAVRLLNGNGTRCNIDPAATWAVEVEFLIVVCKSEQHSDM